MTSKEFIEYQESNQDSQYELIDSRLVKMMATSAIHGILTSSIHSQFWNYLRGKKCNVYPETFTIYIDEENNYAPDISIICDKLDTPDKGTIYHVVPELVVEVISPSNDEREMEIKRLGYKKIGVKEYWEIYNEYEAHIYRFYDDRVYPLVVFMSSDNILRIPVGINDWKLIIKINYEDIPIEIRTNPIYRYNPWNNRPKIDEV